MQKFRELETQDEYNACQRRLDLILNGRGDTDADEIVKLATQMQRYEEKCFAMEDRPGRN